MIFRINAVATKLTKWNFATEPRVLTQWCRVFNATFVKM
jgi:hypothetical protein